MTVWRCRTRVEGGPKACSAPTIKEEELQAGVVRAINSQIGRKSKVIKELAKMIKNMPADGQDAELKKIEKELDKIVEAIHGRLSRERHELRFNDSDLNGSVSIGNIAMFLTRRIHAMYSFSPA